jgi:MFS transporter, DHA1 family, multidrug resistance protein
MSDAKSRQARQPKPEPCVPAQTADFPLGRIEFIGMIAMMFATIAFSIDAMLPALPAIAAELSPDRTQRASLILTAFVLGLGAGTFVAGPLSDALGRRAVVLGGAVIYMLAAAAAAAAHSLELMLLARVVQGLGAAGPRVVSTAVVRDLYAGREMARIISIVMLIFTLVPVIAPALGALIIAGWGWRGVFGAFLVFAILNVTWIFLRLPETLPRAHRRPMRPALMAAGVTEMFRHPGVRLSILAQSLAMAMMFVTLMLVQPIYAQVFGRAETFPYWFGFIAVIAGSASALNAVLVMRYGMQRLVIVAFGVQVLLSATMLALNPDALPEPWGFAAFLVWQTFLFFQAGLTLGNLNAIAMEPMGHIAGMAASVVGAVSTVIAAAIASTVGLGFDGTATPLFLSVLVMALLAFALMMRMGRLAPG